MHPQFTEALFAITKTWKQHKCTSIDEWIKKMLHKHTMGYCTALKRKKILTHATTWMNSGDMMLSKANTAVIPFMGRT